MFGFLRLFGYCHLKTQKDRHSLHHVSHHSSNKECAELRELSVLFHFSTICKISGYRLYGYYNFNTRRERKSFHHIIHHYWVQHSPDKDRVKLRELAIMVPFFSRIKIVYCRLELKRERISLHLTSHHYWIHYLSNKEFAELRELSVLVPFFRRLKKVLILAIWILQFQPEKGKKYIPAHNSSLLSSALSR